MGITERTAVLLFPSAGYRYQVEEVSLGRTARAVRSLWEAFRKAVLKQSPDNATPTRPASFSS